MLLGIGYCFEDFKGCVFIGWQIVGLKVSVLLAETDSIGGAQQSPEFAVGYPVEFVQDAVATPTKEGFAACGLFDRSIRAFVGLAEFLKLAGLLKEPRKRGAFGPLA